MTEKKDYEIPRVNDLNRDNTCRDGNEAEFACFNGDQPKSPHVACLDGRLPGQTCQYGDGGAGAGCKNGGTPQSSG